MPFSLFFAIFALALAVTSALEHIEKLAKLHKHGRHRFCAWLLLGAIVVVVATLEALLCFKIVAFSAPAWLYRFHILVAAIFFAAFLAKALTASAARRVLHERLSKVLWPAWWLTSLTAVAIGFCNILFASP